MITRVRSWWKEKRKFLEVIGITTLLVVLIALIVVIILGYIFRWDWTGLSSYITPPHPKDTDFQRGKTLWDWLQLLIIPAVLAVGVYLLNYTISRNEQNATEQRAQIEREAAEKRTTTERDIALNNQHEMALQSYIDKMSELLLTEHLGELKPEYEEVRKIARARTLTVLQRLDAVRRFSVLLFLHESGLIKKGQCIVELDIANLQGADLRGIHLEEGQLWGAKMQGADLSFAYLSGADLKDASLHGATLIEVDLRGAYLGGVDLTRANLTRAFVTNEQLDAAKSLQDAIMPDGSQHS